MMKCTGVDQDVFDCCFPLAIFSLHLICKLERQCMQVIDIILMCLVWLLEVRLKVGIVVGT